jgi:hypothetical protein
MNAGSVKDSKVATHIRAISYTFIPLVRIYDFECVSPQVGIYAASRGIVRLNLTMVLEGNLEADQGCMDDGRIEREAKAVKMVLARPLSAKTSRR